MHPIYPIDNEGNIKIKPIGYAKSPVKKPQIGGLTEVETEIVLNNDCAKCLDGIEDFSKAYRRREPNADYPIANIRDIIESKQASGRVKDRIELPLLEAFRQEYEKRKRRPLRSATQKASLGRR